MKTPADVIVDVLGTAVVGPRTWADIILSSLEMAGYEVVRKPEPYKSTPPLSATGYEHDM